MSSYKEHWKALATYGAMQIIIITLLDSRGTRLSASKSIAKSSIKYYVTLLKLPKSYIKYYINLLESPMPSIKYYIKLWKSLKYSIMYPLGFSFPLAIMHFLLGESLK